MGNQDWSDVGNNISDMVQQAIDSGDYSKLSQTIQSAVTAAVSSAAEGVAEGISGAGKSMNGAADSFSRSMNHFEDAINRAADMVAGRTKTPVRYKNPPKAQNPWKGDGRFEKKTAAYMGAKDLPDNELYSKGGATRAAGYALSIAGGIGCFGFGIGMLIPWIVSVTTGINVSVALGVQFPFLILSILGVWKGTSILGKIRRFKNYVRALGTRTCISLKELAASTGKNEGATLKDVRKMIECGMFRQGHLDLNGKNLFVTDLGYEAYLADQQRMEQRRVEAIEQAKERAAYKRNDALSDDVKKMIAEGQAYIDRIHESNEAIRDDIVSQKLDGLETVITKIFQYVEQHPESAPETKKLMKYYLPTTIKLLESYQKLNDQPVQGPNIFKSKKEIEDTLDTLNQAFARLFDNLYQDTSMDIKSDISVLNTLLAQEGLTGDRMNV